MSRWPEGRGSFSAAQRAMLIAPVALIISMYVAFQRLTEALAFPQGYPLMLIILATVTLQLGLPIALLLWLWRRQPRMKTPWRKRG